MFKKLALTATLLTALAGSAVALAQPLHEGGGPIAMLERLDLSDAQWLQVHKLMKDHHVAARPLHEREHRLHMALALLDASAPDYAQRLQKLQDDAAQLARDRIQDFAALKTQVDAVLTPQQRAKLADQVKTHMHHPAPPSE